MSKKAKGGCLCGSVKFEITLPTKWCAHCHCSLCRRAHGAGFVTWVGVRSPQFLVTRGEQHLHRYRSSDEAVRSFCSQCGSTLLFESQRWPGEVHVVLANIDTPIDRAPEGHAYLDDKPDWMSALDAELPPKVH